MGKTKKVKKPSSQQEEEQQTTGDAMQATNTEEAGPSGRPVRVYADGELPTTSANCRFGSGSRQQRQRQRVWVQAVFDMLHFGHCLSTATYCSEFGLGTAQDPLAVPLACMYTTLGMQSGS